jgi:hypothetical protein
MNEKQSTNSWDTTRSAIDARVKEIMSRPTLAETLQEHNDKQVARKHSWMDEFKADKASYIFAAISAVFTGILGLILGLAPALVTNPDGSTMITFHTDVLHVMVAILYAASFIAVTEGGFLLAKNKFHAREDGNLTQAVSMGLMILLSFLSILGSGFAGARIGASVLGFLTDFREIPHATQVYVVSAIPVLFGLYLLALMFYRLSSMEAKNKRLTENTARKLREDHALRMTLVELDESEQLQIAEIEAYKKAVAEGRLTAADAMAARRAKKTLRQLEAERGQDLNGDGVIERIPEPVAFSKNGKDKQNFQ